MSEKNEKKGPAQAPAQKASPKEPSAKGPVASENCKFEECKKKTEKFGFCMEHYDLYMEGVIRGDGKKPSDYSQKLARFLKSKSERKAA